MAHVAPVAVAIVYEIPTHRRAVLWIRRARCADFLAEIEVGRTRKRGLQRMRHATRFGIGHEMRKPIGVVVLKRGPATKDELDAGVIDHVAQSL